MRRRVRLGFLPYAFGPVQSVGRGLRNVCFGDQVRPKRATYREWKIALDFILGSLWFTEHSLTDDRYHFQGVSHILRERFAG